MERRTVGEALGTDVVDKLRQRDAGEGFASVEDAGVECSDGIRKLNGLESGTLEGIAIERGEVGEVLYFREVGDAGVVEQSTEVGHHGSLLDRYFTVEVEVEAGDADIAYFAVLEMDESEFVT